MELEGKVWKSGKHWLVEVPSLDIMTQGYSKEAALMMIRDVWRRFVFPRSSSMFKSLKEGKSFSALCWKRY